MTEQLTEVRVVTLDDLKRSIEMLPLHPGPCTAGQNADRWLSAWHEYHRWSSEAWRTAFEWLASWERRVMLDPEYDEGMRLIREKLQ